MVMQFPNSWALNMLLALEKGSMMQRDNSNIVLAAILIQIFAGRVPKERLLPLIEACL
jgi:hypothetical protein